MDNIRCLRRMCRGEHWQALPLSKLAQISNDALVNVPLSAIVLGMGCSLSRCCFLGRSLLLLLPARSIHILPCEGGGAAVTVVTAVSWTASGVTSEHKVKVSAQSAQIPVGFPCACAGGSATTAFNSPGCSCTRSTPPSGGVSASNRRWSRPNNRVVVAAMGEKCPAQRAMVPYRLKCLIG